MTLEDFRLAFKRLAAGETLVYFVGQDLAQGGRWEVADEAWRYGVEKGAVILNTKGRIIDHGLGLGFLTQKRLATGDLAYRITKRARC